MGEAGHIHTCVLSLCTLSVYSLCVLSLCTLGYLPPAETFYSLGGLFTPSVALPETVYSHTLGFLRLFTPLVAEPVRVALML